MVLPGKEAIDLIFNLLTQHAPDSLDRRNAFDFLQEQSKAGWLVSGQKCVVCGEELACVNPKCDDYVKIDVYVGEPEVTVRIKGKEVYSY